MTEASESDKKCRQCGSGEIRPVVYGLPSEQTFARAALGEILLGGCVITGNDPDWRCAKCGTPFNMDEFAPDWVKELLADRAERERNAGNTEKRTRRDRSEKKTPPEDREP